MTRALLRTAQGRAGRLVSLLAACSLLAPALAIAAAPGAQAAVFSPASHASHASPSTASDDFNRADGSLGPNWADISDGPLAITSDNVAGTAGSGLTGDTWTAQTFTTDQFSQISITGTQLTGGQWIGASVRTQNGGKDAYAGIYFWNSGSPELMLFKRSAGNWTQLGNAYSSGALAAGAVLKVTAVGSAISLLENGIQRISVTDASLTGGGPGIMAFGTSQAGNWSGGDEDGASYTVGGTVSGLSGTVVLQDSGADSLSVSANGSFTFATSLASGAPYNVTVATYPSGQVCTVASGSGTITTASISAVKVSCANGKPATSASDNFNRADGPLGPNWSPTSDGGMAITGDVAAGTASSGLTGDLWTAGEFSTDQLSQFQTTSAQLTGGQWIGAAVRAQSAGQDGYVGVYYWNNGSPEMLLFKRSGGDWSQLGAAYSSGALSAGTTIAVSAVGSTISVLEGGTSRISVTDTSFTGGAPGLMAFGASQADNWSGGDAAGGSGGAGPAIYTVGGTVSGLTGTVVLQDNGSDLLTVKASGSFTFAAKLPAGATYTVAVATYPTGQVCTVSHGTGKIAAASITSVAVRCVKGRPVSTVADSFNRANGALGPDWTGISDGALAIAGHAVTGTTAGLTGDIRSAEVFPSDQFSQLAIGPTQLTGSQWIGAAVRMQDGGQSGYVGIYYWNNGSPELVLFKRANGGWADLGSWSSGPLAAGTTLRLMAVGTTIAFLENGVQRIGVGDTGLSGGAPGIMINGTAGADSWSGGTQGFAVDYISTDAAGLKTYDVISAANSGGPQPLRILTPTSPARGVRHNFLFVLPVESGLQADFGDGLKTVQALGAQNTYNLTVIAPSFGIDPWYADNPANASAQYETFLTTELVPWVEANLSTTGREQSWLLGFSKSGIGGQDLILKHPNLFTLAATWDFPADMTSDTEFGFSSESGYGTNANFQQGYELSKAFVAARKAPFVRADRMWIGGYALFQKDDADYNTLLTSLGIQHDTEAPPAPMAHRWDSGWVPLALAALYTESQHVQWAPPPACPSRGKPGPGQRGPGQRHCQPGLPPIHF